MSVYDHGSSRYKVAATIKQLSVKGNIFSSNDTSTHSEEIDENDVTLEEDAAAGPNLKGGVVDKMTSNHGTETFAQKCRRVKATSEFRGMSNWRLDGLIAKSNDDLRQEVFVMQLITYFDDILRQAEVDALLYTYRIVSTSKSTGLIQLIPDAFSLDSLKKQASWPGSLRLFFEHKYGPVGSDSFENAMGNYIASLAAYSIVTYLLGIKDRYFFFYIFLLCEIHHALI